MRPVPAHLGRQPHHDCFRDDQSARRVEIGAHPVGVHLEALQHEAGLRQRAAGEREDRRQCDPLDLPRPRGALVILHHRVEECRHPLPDEAAQAWI